MFRNSSCSGGFHVRLEKSTAGLGILCTLQSFQCPSHTNVRARLRITECQLYVTIMDHTALRQCRLSLYFLSVMAEHSADAVENHEQEYSHYSISSRHRRNHTRLPETDVCSSAKYVVSSPWANASQHDRFLRIIDLRLKQ